MIRSKAEILHEYGPFPGIDKVAGVTYDGGKLVLPDAPGLGVMERAAVA